jgi:hypothetical protein
MIYGILLIILGLLAIPSLILSKKPNAKELLDKITPYQNWIGFIFAFWGIWGIIRSAYTIGWLTNWPIYWITALLVSVVEASLGFILGHGSISKYALSKNPQTAEKREKLLAKLTPLQGKLGIVAIILGVWQVIASFLWIVA